MMKSKIEDDSGETCRRMILDASQAALDLMLSMPLGPQQEPHGLLGNVGGRRPPHAFKH